MVRVEIKLPSVLLTLSVLNQVTTSVWTTWATAAQDAQQGSGISTLCCSVEWSSEVGLSLVDFKQWCFNDCTFILNILPSYSLSPQQRATVDPGQGPQGVLFQTSSAVSCRQGVMWDYCWFVLLAFKERQTQTADSQMNRYTTCLRTAGLKMTELVIYVILK